MVIVFILKAAFINIYYNSAISRVHLSSYQSLAAEAGYAVSTATGCGVADVNPRVSGQSGGANQRHISHEAAVGYRGKRLKSRSIRFSQLVNFSMGQFGLMGQGQP